jgi:hypothetical protein
MATNTGDLIEGTVKKIKEGCRIVRKNHAEFSQFDYRMADFDPSVPRAVLSRGWFPLCV